jgi:ubiquinone/menaquinone biosynthesis C-methylase UbiE
MPTYDYFESGMDAARYARARPDIHSSVIERVRKFIQGTGPCTRALDVGCGTGQSTVAVKAIAESVVGIDPSSNMLAHAVPHAKVSYREGAAENIPFPDEHFDLVTAGLAFHWFDADRFFAEAARLLTPSGWLIIYNSGFTGQVREVAAMEGWFHDEFLKRYPTPPRNTASITAAFAEAHGVALVGDEPLSNDVEMSVDGFVDYELSTTNIISVVRDGASFEAVESWMRKSLASIFQHRREGTFCFAGRIWYLRKQAT